MRALLLVLCFSAQAGAQSLGASVSALPSTGVDFSSVDAFYHIADIIARDKEPSLEEWRSLLSTPGYQLVVQNNPIVRQTFVNALSPSRRSERDAILARDSDAAFALRHIMRAYQLRTQILATRDMLVRTMRDSITASLTLAGRFLPAGHATRNAPPFVAFAIFNFDGYAVDGGVVIDPLFVKEEGLVLLLAHEFHHALSSTLDRTIRAQFGAQAPHDAGFAMPLIKLRTEGIADLIDKQPPLPVREGPLAWYAPRYNDFYARSPQILKSIDSLLVIVRDNGSRASDAAVVATRLLWSNSHPTGAFMARTILQTFGVDSLLPGLYNPFAFLRAYSAAQVRNGKPSVWSRKALEMIADMERRYIAR